MKYMIRPPEANSLTERLAAIADPVRLRLVRLLETAELSVGEVARVLQAPQSTVSRHLKVLAGAGWTHRRTEGTATLYQVRLDDLPSNARSLWLTVRDCLGEDVDVLEDRRRLDAVLAQRRTDSRSFFGRVAGDWDSVRRELFGDPITPLGLIGLIDESWTVADLGCGTGNAAELLAPYVARVIAVDFSEPMLDAARRRLDGASNIEFVVGSVEAIPLEDAAVDASVLMLVLHHVPDPGAALREAARITRPGGKALVIDMFAHTREEYERTMGHRHLGFEPARLRALFEGAGLESVRVTALPGDPDAKGPSLFAATARTPIAPDRGPKPPME